MPILSVRITDDEWATLEARRQAAGLRSISKVVRLALGLDESDGQPEGTYPVEEGGFVELPIYPIPEHESVAPNGTVFRA